MDDVQSLSYIEWDSRSSGPGQDGGDVGGCVFELQGNKGEVVI